MKAAEGEELARRLSALSERVGYQFRDPELLQRAMAHRSWCAEAGLGIASNERLEFLGDAVLGWVIADLAYRRFDQLPEGKLTDLRKSVVNATALAAVARELEIGCCLLLGKGESAANGQDKPSILSDAFEAVLGALYLDGGSDAAYKFVERALGPRLDLALAQIDRLDHKTLLQELSARRFDVAPVYVVSDQGPDHAKEFTATVVIAGRHWGRGDGRSKKLAEQAAALQAYEALCNEPVIEHPAFQANRQAAEQAHA